MVMPKAVPLILVAFAQQVTHTPRFSNLKFNSGLFQLLPDEMIIEILELLGPDTLLKFGSTCKALFGFSRFEELWKNVIIR